MICPEDLQAVEAGIAVVVGKLLIVDPLVAHLPDTVNANRDQDIRRSLLHLRCLAERTGAAVVAVRHLNKNPGTNALYRGGGSIGIVAAARMGLLLASDPDCPDGSDRILAVSKSNLAPKPPSMRLSLVAAGVGEHSRVQWIGATHHTASSLLSEPSSPHEQSALEDATEFVRELLASGPRSAQEVFRAAHREGISPATLNRAKKRLGVVSKKTGNPGRAQAWAWELPGPRLGDYEDLHSSVDDDLRPTEDHKPYSAHEKAQHDHPDGVEGLRTIVFENCAPAAEEGTPESPKAPPIPSDHLLDAIPSNGGNGPAVCAQCGGAILHWSFGPVCSGCRLRVGLAAVHPEPGEQCGPGHEGGHHA
jgi:hypothetical protein